MARGVAIAFALAAAPVLCLVSCGGDGTTITEPARAETVDPPAELAAGWSSEVDAEAGFSIGLPPGWSIARAEGGQGSVLRSPDRLVVVSASADRTAGALALPLDQFATRTARALAGDPAGAGQLQDLRVGSARPFRDVYEAVAVRARGSNATSGVRERILVVVLRRRGRAAYVVISRENAERRSKFADPGTVPRIARSLRGRPAA